MQPAMRNSTLLFLILPIIFALLSCAGKDMVLSNQGFEELSRGNDLEASMRLEQALVMNPDNPYALLNLGVVYQRMGRPEKARRMYQKVLALQTQEKAETSNNPAFSGRSLGEIAEANLKLLEDGVSTELPPQRRGQEGVARQEDTPALPIEKEGAGESNPEQGETVYRVREGETLFDIAARHDVYGDRLKWPIVFLLNMDKFGSTEALLNKPIQKGTELRMVQPRQASKRAAMMEERLWVVNALSVRSLDKTVLPATALMKKGYSVYLIKTEFAGDEWIGLRVGFYANILDAMAVCEEIRPLMDNSGEPCVVKIDTEEFEKNAGFIRFPEKPSQNP
jgi:tetratricopeptide (TPR) repeat protein